MLKYLILLISFKDIYSTQCSCGLGYRNGAQASDANLCMGPAESSGRPCYPTPCNADWTACTTQPSTNELWTKDSTHTGKRPDCPFVKINNEGLNYIWLKLSKCKDKCNDTKKSNVKEITSDILYLREVCLIILVIILSGTNCYLIYYIRLNKIVNIIPRNQTTLGIEMTNYTLYGQKHREQSPRNEVIVTAVPVLPK